MILKICIVICVLFVYTVVFGILAKLYLEYKHFNGGICPKCGKPLIKIDVDLQGDRGYYCYQCKHAAVVSYRWIDKNFKNKI